MALEEYLLHHVQEEEVILYLWQNQNTIVIGKNQNPWKECRVSQVERDGVSLARRLSGGGAVYHDLGNLNFTFIMRDKLYNLEKQLQVIIDAVQNLGIEATFTGKNDITVEGRKFSGNAFYFSNQGSYHHGTILVNTDMNPLTKYLQVSREKLESKGIDSVRSRVINLVELNPELTIENVNQALEKSFETIYGGPIEKMKLPQKENLEDYIQKYTSWEWRFGETPKFNIEFEKRFDFGTITFLFLLKDSKIQDVTIYSDAIFTDILENIKKILVGVPFSTIKIIEALSSLSTKNNEEEKIIQDIQQWLLEKEI